jgi:transposase-like protein
MGFLDRLRGRKSTSATAQAHPPPPDCPHTALVPHWDDAADMGKEDKITSYKCEACQDTFSHEEGERLKAAEADRVRHLEA